MRCFTDQGWCVLCRSCWRVRSAVAKPLTVADDVVTSARGAGMEQTARVDWQTTREALASLVAHATVPGRVRLVVSVLYRQPALAAQVERELGRIAGVKRARASALTATVLVVFDPSLDAGALASQLAAALGARPASISSERAGSEELVRHLPGPSALDLLDALGDALARARGRRPSRTSAQSRDALLEAPRETAPPWHALEGDEVVARWGSSRERGLSRDEARARLERYGPNALPAPKRRSEIAIFVAQLRSVPVVLLAGSALLSLTMGGVGDALAILGVVMLNAVIGYVTESGAERTIGSLVQGDALRARVVREGEVVEIAAEEVVPGDLLVLRAALPVAADARVLAADSLIVDESALTGESAPVTKTAARLGDGRRALADRVNMVYRGTIVTGGSGLALVVATGSDTEIGRIQGLVESVATRETPLQRQLRHLGGQLAFGAGVVCAGVFALGLLRGYGMTEMLRVSVSLAVAAVPEGLPTVAVTTLAIGLQRLQARGVLVRHLGAVEALGALEVLCLDKTGTITLNRMSVVAVLAGKHAYEVRDGRFFEGGTPIDALARPELEWLLRVGVLCSEVELASEGGATVLRGTPTESALVRVALDAGIDVLAERSRRPVLRTRLRTETRSFMETLHGGEGDARILAIKGRPSEVLAMCRYWLVDGVRRVLSDEDRQVIATANERMAGQALRVLGVAFGEYRGEAPEVARDLVWVGLVGMADPPREGIREVLARFHRAGIDTVMITGDQSATAYAVGRRIGLGRGGDLEILDSTRLEELEPELLRALAPRVQVFSRVSPAHKLQIVRALQAAGRVVAMTGDGINDGPALRAADVGVAMGAAGTPAAREVAGVVLRHDDLAAMADAVEQGRAIYDDIKKAVHFILATNLSEILLTFAAVAGGMGEALTPMQLLWINLLTDVLPELALAVEPPEPDVMLRPPRGASAQMFARRELARIGLEGTVITSGALAAYVYGLRRYGPGPRAGTLAFTSLTCAQLLHALSARSERHGLFDPGHLARNPWLPATLVGSFALQGLATFVPPLRSLLGTAPLGAGDWLRTAIAAVGPFVANEAIKALREKPAERKARERVSAAQGDMEGQTRGSGAGAATRETERGGLRCSRISCSRRSR